MKNSVLQDPHLCLNSASAKGPAAGSGHLVNQEPQQPEALRHWVHNTLQTLFIAKGFCEELQTQIASRRYLKSNFDHENFIDLILALGRNLDRYEGDVRSLKTHFS